MGTKNTMDDLNNHLFAEMERLDDEDLSDDRIDTEIKRSNAISSLGGTIIENAALILKAKIAFGDNLSAATKDRPRILLGDGSDGK